MTHADSAPLSPVHPAAPMDAGGARSSWRVAAMLALILALALGVRCRHLTSRSLWGDEIFSLFASSGNTGPAAGKEGFLPNDWNLIDLHRAGPWSGIWKTQTRDLHPPVYFLILRAWRVALGDSHAALRSLSVLCSMLSIVVLFLIVRDAFDATTALWACAIVAVAMQHVAYAREVRQYSMQILWGTLAVYMLLRIERRGASLARLIALAAILWLLAETHYFFVGVALAIGLYALIYCRPTVRRRTVAAMVVAGAIFLITAGPFLVQQLHDAPIRSGGLKVHETHHLLHTIVRMAGTPFTLLADPPKSLIRLVPLTGVAMLLPLAFFRRNPKLVLMWMWAALPIAVVGLSDLLGGMQQLTLPRYAVLSIPAIAALAAATLRPYRILRHLAPAAVFAVCLWMLPELYKPYAFNNFANRHREMAMTLKADVQPGEAVVFVDDPRFHESNQLKAQVYVYYVPHHLNPIALGYLDSPEFQNELNRFSRVWLVGSRTTDTSHFLPGATTESVKQIGQFCIIRSVNP